VPDGLRVGDARADPYTCADGHACAHVDTVTGTQPDPYADSAAFSDAGPDRNASADTAARTERNDG
jgi:hypothetical protein